MDYYNKYLKFGRGRQQHCSLSIICQLYFATDVTVDSAEFRLHGAFCLLIKFTKETGSSAGFCLYRLFHETFRLRLTSVNPATLIQRHTLPMAEHISSYLEGVFGENVRFQRLVVLVPFLAVLTLKASYVIVHGRDVAFQFGSHPKVSATDRTHVLCGVCMCTTHVVLEMTAAEKRQGTSRALIIPSPLVYRANVSLNVVLALDGDVADRTAEGSSLCPASVHRVWVVVEIPIGAFR